jgi:3-hydroxyisobutyrate dehydrogenase
MKIAFIGLGAMGLPMARNLASLDGTELSAFDVSAERLRQIEGSARLASSTADAVQGADAVFTVLPADQHVAAVAREVAAAQAGNRWFADFSTVSPATIEDVAACLTPLGTQTISVVLTRSTAAAQAGTLGLFVGGVTDLPAGLAAALNAMASDVFVVGSLGAAKAFKVINNMMVAALDIAINEAIVLGGVAGLAPQQVTDTLAGQGVGSWVLPNHIVRYVLPDDLGPGRFSTRYMAKDVALCNALARQHGIPAFFAGLASSYYRGCVAYGFGDDYHLKVIRWLEAGAAVPRKVDCDAGETLAALVSAVAAVQALVSYEAIELARLSGMAPEEAARHFENGSAGNTGLDWWRRPAGQRGPAPTLASLIDDLVPALDLAARLDVPATTFDVARHRALSVAGSHGGLHQPLWAVAE